MSNGLKDPDDGCLYWVISRQTNGAEEELGLRDFRKVPNGNGGTANTKPLYSHFMLPSTIHILFCYPGLVLKALCSQTEIILVRRLSKLFCLSLVPFHSLTSSFHSYLLSSNYVFTFPDSTPGPYLGRKRNRETEKAQNSLCPWQGRKLVTALIDVFHCAGWVDVKHTILVS